MKYCSPFCAGWWPFLLLPMLLLLPLLFFQARGIERMVAANAQDLLSAQHQWAKAETFNHGRDVLVIGTAPSQQVADLAVSLAAGAKGVRTARFIGKITKPLEAARITLNFQGSTVLLDGVVDSRSTIDLLLASARGGYRGRTIVDQLRADSNTAAPTDLNWLFTATSALGDGNSIDINSNRLTVRGEVKSEQIKRTIHDQLSSNFSGSVDNQLSIAVDLDAMCVARLNKILSNAQISFESASATLQANSHVLLDQLAMTTKACDNAHFEVAGHTDAAGAEKFNLSLSQRRAQTVVDYFIKSGVNAAKLTARGYGSSRPVADNTSAAGRAANRRIEFTTSN